jgi:hypothetical protein
MTPGDSNHQPIAWINEFSESKDISNDPTEIIVYEFKDKLLKECGIRVRNANVLLFYTLNQPVSFSWSITSSYSSSLFFLNQPRSSTVSLR